MDSADTLYWKIDSLNSVLIAARNYHSEYWNDRVIQVTEKELEKLHVLFPEAQERERLEREEKEIQLAAKRERDIEVLLNSVVDPEHREELEDLLIKRQNVKIPLKKQTIENRLDQLLFIYRIELRKVNV